MKHSDTPETIEGEFEESPACSGTETEMGAGTAMVSEFGIEAAFIVALVVMGPLPSS